MAINAGATNEPLLINPEGLPAGKKVGEYQIYVTNAEHDLARMVTKHDNGRYVIPAKSIVTLVAPVEAR